MPNASKQGLSAFLGSRSWTNKIVPSGLFEKSFNIVIGHSRDVYTPSQGSLRGEINRRDYWLRLFR
jgi:hypothetical protein